MKKLFSIMSNLQNPLSLQTRFPKYGPTNVVIVDGVHTQVVSKSYEFLFERPTKSELKFVAGHFICNLREWATGPTVPSITGDTASVFIISVIWFHYNDVTMSAMASQSTNPTIVYSSVYRGTDRKKQQSSASWLLCGEFTGELWSPHTKGQQRGKCFHLMTSSCLSKTSDLV